jgi:hypothetical protein
MRFLTWMVWVRAYTASNRRETLHHPFMMRIATIQARDNRPGVQQNSVHLRQLRFLITSLRACGAPIFLDKSKLPARSPIRSPKVGLSRARARRSRIYSDSLFLSAFAHRLSASRCSLGRRMVSVDVFTQTNLADARRYARHGRSP